MTASNWSQSCHLFLISNRADLPEPVSVILTSKNCILSKNECSKMKPIFSPPATPPTKIEQLRSLIFFYTPRCTSTAAKQLPSTGTAHRNTKKKEKNEAFYLCPPRPTMKPTRFRPNGRYNHLTHGNQFFCTTSTPKKILFTEHVKRGIIFYPITTVGAPNARKK